jgi:peroxiredoxin (alkyl hydroperoxide reductase subunit C)
VQQQWAKAQGFTFPSSATSGRTVQWREYGVFNEQLGCANRVTFVIDRQGTVIDRFDAPNLDTARDASSYRAALVKLD